MAMIHIHKHPTREPAVPKSYEHMMGKEHRAHEGSQSEHPNPEFGANAEYGTSTMNDHDEDDRMPSKRGKKLPEKSPTGLSYADE